MEATGPATVARPRDGAEPFPWRLFLAVGTVCLLGSVLPLLVAWPAVNGVIRNAAIAGGTLWLLVAWGRLEAPLRMPGAIVGVLLLQVWSGVTVLLAAALIGRLNPLGTIDFFLMRHLFVFLAASAVVYFAPEWRLRLADVLLAAIGLVALAGVADFVAPQQWAPVREAMGAATIDRPVGISGYHSHLAILCNFGIALLAGRAWFARISWGHFALFALLALASLAAQARAHVPGLAIASGAFLVGLFFRDRRRGFVLGGALLALLLVAVAAFPGKFQTLLGTDLEAEPTLQGRKALTWPQVDFVLEHLPWSGLGPEPVFWGAVGGGTDKWAPFHAIDAGFLLLAACYGYVGLGIAIVTFVVYGVGLARVIWLDRNPKRERSQLAVAQLACLAAVLVAMYANNIVTWDDAMSVLFLLGGLTQLGWREERRLRARAHEEAACIPSAS
ncbi:MAG: hypothetical protein LDL55_04325 [Armatimonadetes bacterium]|nr:hypothetical protein [Armatimonadota bacterium]